MDIDGFWAFLERSAAHGQPSPSGPDPTDRAWDFDSLAEIQRRLPRLADLFPRQRGLKA